MSASGSTTVPIECPAGSCSGAVGLELGGMRSTRRSTTRRGRGRAALPRAGDLAEPVIASAHFHLEAGHRGVCCTCPAAGASRGRSPRHRSSRRHAGNGRDALRYVAGQGHLRA